MSTRDAYYDWQYTKEDEADSERKAKEAAAKYEAAKARAAELREAELKANQELDAINRKLNTLQVSELPAISKKRRELMDLLELLSPLVHDANNRADGLKKEYTEREKEFRQYKNARAAG